MKSIRYKRLAFFLYEKRLFFSRDSHFHPTNIGDNNSSQGGPQSPLGGGGLQNSSWSNISSNNTMMNHNSGVECDVNTMNYGQPPPGISTQQHQQQQV